ncbi:MAG TPA: hypothetical protein VL357_12230 [Rariglobus sp.]|jgi:hypothetical protein|nr:hypothetical protein [Rariglobus sp.]
MPRIIICLLCIAVTLSAQARDFSKKPPLELKSRYFDFHYQRTNWDAKAFARFADEFVDLINRDFFKVDFDYPIQVLVFTDRETFQAFLRTEFGERNPPGYGIYLGRLKLFATYEDSGLGTFAHEIMHPLVEHNLRDRPAWAVEAIPSFFEKFYGYYDGGTLKIHWGYQNPWRIHALGTRLFTLDLETIIHGVAPANGYDTSELRLISVFLWQQGKFQRLIHLIAQRQHNGFSSYFEAAMEMPMKDIIPLWKRYLDDIVDHRDLLLQLPASQVFDNEAEFSSFVTQHEITLFSESK